MSDSICITGISGSGGSYLAEYILENHPNIKVTGFTRWHSTSRMDNIEHIKDKIDVYECDLLDVSSIIRVLEKVYPSRIFHLAAYANVKKCFDTPLAVVNNNIMGTANLLEAVRISCPDSIIQVCSTSEVYGNPLTIPITEDHPLQPVNPYAVSKLAQEKLAYAYHKSWGLKVIITRMFAYINPRRHDLFATAFAMQLARLERGETDKIRHGNLDSIRTLIDVRDAMETYWIACDRCKYGEAYNIGGNDTISVGRFLDKLKDHSILPITKPIECECDSALLRPIDVTRQVPDCSKFQKVTNWTPKYTLEDSIKFLLEYCRNV